MRALVTLGRDPSRSCTEARDLAQDHLTVIRARLEELMALERSIAGFVTACDTQCAGGPGPDCTILDDLATDPSRAPAGTCCP